MASAADALTITYEGQWATKMLLEPIFHSDDIMRHYTVYPNVKYKQNVLLANSLNKIVMANGGCSSSDNSGSGLSTSFNITDKEVTVANCSVKQSQCWDTFYNEFIVESYAKGINMPDLTGTDLADVISNRVRLGIQQDIVRVMWGGDTALANVTYSWGDGLFKLMDAGSVGLETLGVSGGTGQTAVGGTLVGTDCDALLAQVFDGAPANLQQTPASEKRMFVTPNIYNAWYGNLTMVGQAGAVDYSHSEAQTGINYNRLHFRGVEIVPMYEWDTIMTDDDPALWNTGGTNYKNGVVYTTKSNLIIASDVNDPSAQFNMFYDQVTDNMYIRSYFKIGYQYAYDSLAHCGVLVN
jgi:hypothetical protein